MSLRGYGSAEWCACWPSPSTGSSSSRSPSRRYRSRPGIAGKSTYVGDLGFDEFVGRVVTGEIRLRPQSDYVTSPDGRLAVDRLWRYDDLDSAFEWMRAKVGKNKIKLPQRNVSPPREHEVTAATRDLIEEAYAADLTLYRSLG